MCGETKKKCFVVSPIGDDATPERAQQKKHANTVLKTFIRPALKGFIDDVTRADEISEPGDINQQVLERLAKDDLVVADLSFHNPNVFYELAIRHMLGKPYVQMIRKGERIPFDIGSKRTIMFDLTDLDSLEDTRELIRKQAEACLAPGFKVDTPLGVAVTVESLRADDPVQRSLSLILEKLDGLAPDRDQALRDAIYNDTYTQGLGTSLKRIKQGVFKGMTEADLDQLTVAAKLTLDQDNEDSLLVQKFGPKDIATEKFRAWVKQLIGAEAWREKAQVDVEALTDRALGHIKQFLSTHPFVLGSMVKRLAETQV